MISFFFRVLREKEEITQSKSKKQSKKRFKMADIVWKKSNKWARYCWQVLLFGSRLGFFGAPNLPLDADLYLLIIS